MENCKIVADVRAANDLTYEALTGIIRQFERTFNVDVGYVYVPQDYVLELVRDFTFCKHVVFSVEHNANIFATLDWDDMLYSIQSNLYVENAIDECSAIVVYSADCQFRLKINTVNSA